jgi:CRISPR/Cas system CSM-associated protein Csm2 small subunit
MSFYFGKKGVVNITNRNITPEFKDRLGVVAFKLATELADKTNRSETEEEFLELMDELLNKVTK